MYSNVTCLYSYEKMNILKDNELIQIVLLGLSQAVEVNRHVVEEVKEAIKNERLVDIPPPTLTRSSKNGNENCGSDTSVTRQQLSKLSLSDVSHSVIDNEVIINYLFGLLCIQMKKCVL